MGAVFVDMSMSFDGFIAGPNDDQENPLGDDGERLHEWVFDLASWREQQGLDGGFELRGWSVNFWDDQMFELDMEQIVESGALPHDLRTTI